MPNKKLTFKTSLVVDCVDLPLDVAEWLIDRDVSVHYDNSVLAVWPDEADNPLFKWLIAEGVELDQFRTDQGIVYISFLGT